MLAVVRDSASRCAEVMAVPQFATALVVPA
jgi:hypothetical protein